MIDKARTDEDLAGPLIRFLQRALDAPSLGIGSGPVLLARGGQADIYTFTLSDPVKETEWAEAPLVCRLFRNPATQGADVFTVAAFQNALASLGYPAPRVIAASAHSGDLGAPFLVMERAEGYPGYFCFGVAVLLCIGLALLGCIFFPAAFAIPISMGFVLLSAFAILGITAQSLLHLHRLPISSFTEKLKASGIRPNELEFGLLTIEDLDQQIEQASAQELEPGAAWLRDNLAVEEKRKVICHFDHHPDNLMISPRGNITVIDWGMTVLAEPEFDIAWNRVVNIIGLFLIPSRTSAERLAGYFLGPLISTLVWTLLRLQERLYRRSARLKPDKIRYFTAFFSLRALLLFPAGPEHLHRRLRRRFKRATGVSISFKQSKSNRRGSP